MQNPPSLRRRPARSRKAQRAKNPREAGKTFTRLCAPQSVSRVGFQTLVPDKLYSPTEVAEILSASYNTALRLMVGTSKTVDLAKPRTRKRLLRIRGKHLREYLDGKLK